MIAFLLVAIVVIVAPGPDFALTVRNSVTRHRGVATALGVVTGQLAWALATAAGLAAVLVASRPAFEALRLAGAAYLVWLGASLLIRRGHEPRGAQPGRPFRHGLWLSCVAHLGGKLRVPVVRRALETVSGLVLVAFGIHLAAERR